MHQGSSLLYWQTIWLENSDQQELKFTMHFHNQVLSPHLDIHDTGPYPPCDMTVPEKCLFLALFTQMGHNLSESLDYW
jgi:hypothetical protein